MARVAASPDGLTVLVGKSAADNDVVTFKLASPNDFWYHTSGQSGSHVVVLNPAGLERMPRDTRRFAAALAAGYSSSREGGRVAVHEARVRDVAKPRGFPPGMVTLRRFEAIRGAPLRLDEDGE